MSTKLKVPSDSFTWTDISAVPLKDVQNDTLIRPDFRLNSANVFSQTPEASPTFAGPELVVSPTVTPLVEDHPVTIQYDEKNNEMIWKSPVEIRLDLAKEKFVNVESELGRTPQALSAGAPVKSLSSKQGIVVNEDGSAVWLFDPDAPESKEMKEKARDESRR